MSWSTDPEIDLSETLQYARDYFIEHLPAGFASMNSKDQSQKLRKRQAMETNWNAYIGDCVPEEIKPRQSLYKGHKAKTGEGAAALPWWQWSLKLIQALHRMSDLTKGKLSFAQELMLLEVSKRQKDMTNSARQRQELLMQDVERILAALLKRLDQGPVEVSRDEDSEDELNRDFEDTRPAVKQESPEQVGFVQTEGFQEPVQIKREITHDAQQVAVPNPRKKPKRSHTPAKIATLRAKAMRHQEQASRLEAEAFELEAKHLAEQA